MYNAIIFQAFSRSLEEEEEETEMSEEGGAEKLYEDDARAS